MNRYEEVSRLLDGIDIPRTIRRTFGHESIRTVTMGFVHKPYSSYRGYSKFTEQHPELWDAILRLGADIDPEHKFSSVTINHNVLCPPHRDKKNLGNTMIVGLGDYTGGELVIEGEAIDIRYKPHYFNGFLREHWNNKWTGDRYSLMFYNTRYKQTIEHRPCDSSILREVYYGNQYHRGGLGFGIERGDHWIDIGAHIGCFSKKVLDNGGTVSSYEPDPESYLYLVRNVGQSNAHNVSVGLSSGKVTLLHGSKPYFNKISQEPGTTEQLAFSDLISPGSCVKMDIEGSEMEILDHCDFGGIRKMVLAYHVNVDSSRTNFLRRMNRLREWFTVHHQEVKGEIMKFFPNEIIVYCIMKRDKIKVNIKVKDKAG